MDSMYDQSTGKPCGCMAGITSMAMRPRDCACFIVRSALKSWCAVRRRLRMC